MGLFDFLKKKKNILQVDFDISSEPLYVYPSNKIKLPMSAIVPKDCEMYLCDGGKILDTFKEGTYELNIASLPKCDKRFKLSKPDKDGKLAKYFFCEIYIVNKVLFKYKNWKTYRKAVVVDKKVGEFNVSFKGAFAFQIVDTVKFVTSMLKEYEIIKNKEAENILSGYVGEYVLSEIEKRQVGLEEILSYEKLVDELFDDINKKLDFLGIEFMGFNIENYSLPKRLKPIKQNIEQEKEVGNNLFKREREIKQKLDETKNDDELLHFDKDGTRQIKIEKNKILLNVDKNNTSQTLNDKKNLKINEQSKNCIDSNDKKYYDNTQQKVRCLFCGYENIAQDEKCAICGQTLKRKGRL